MVCLKGFLFGHYTDGWQGLQTTMKGGEKVITGTILYAAKNDSKNCMDDATLQGQIPAWEDIVEIVAQNNRHSDIHHAWRKLIAQGMH